VETPLSALILAGAYGYRVVANIFLISHCLTMLRVPSSPLADTMSATNDLTVGFLGAGMMASAIMVS
jgi:hypothetical protein